MSETRRSSTRRASAAAIVTMNRPQVRNAQNAKMTYALDEAFVRAMDDDAVKVIVLAGAGPHFSAGHDIGTPERDIHKSFPRVATTWWEHEDKDGRGGHLRPRAGALPRHVPALARAARSRRSRWCRARASRAG